MTKASLLRTIIAKRRASILRGEKPTTTVISELRAEVARRKAAAPPPEPEPTPEPVKEPKPGMIRETPDVMGDWPKTTGIEPIPKKFLGLPEHRTRIKGIIRIGEKRISESLKAEEEWKAGIIPTETYRVPMIGGRHVSQEELDVYLAGKPPDWIPESQIFTGAELLAFGEPKYATYRKDVSTQLTKMGKHLTETYEWHPETKVEYVPVGERITTKQVELGFWSPLTRLGMSFLGGPPKATVKKVEKITVPKWEIQFPYAGAERYKYYEKSLKEAGFFGLFATALTPEDPLGIVSAFYASQGETQRALDVKIKALHRTTTIKSPLDFGKYWIESPITQIGLVTAAAPVVAKGIAYTGGMAFAKWGAKGALTVKGIAAVGGGALITKEAFDIKGEFEAGRPGEAWSRIGVLGISLTGAYAGYKSVSPKVKAGLYEAGQIRVLSKQLPFIEKGALTKFQWGIPGERMATISRYQEYSVRGVPIERTRYGLTEITAWKPPSKHLHMLFSERLDKMTMGKALFAPTRWTIPQKYLYISFPGTKGLEVGPTLRGLGLGTGKIRGYEAITKIKPLIRGKEFHLFRFLSPKIKGRIYTVKHGEFTDIKMLTIKEAYGYGGISKTLQKTIPRAIFKPEISDLPVFVRGEISPSIFAPFFFQFYKREPVFESKLSYRELTAPVVGIKPIQLQIPIKTVSLKKSFFTIQEPHLEQIQETSLAQMQAQMQKQIQKSLTKQIYKPPSPIRKKPPSFVEEPIIGGIPFIFPPTGLYGRGRRYYDEELFGRKYRFRKGDIYNPLKDLGFSKKKSTKRKRKRR